MTDGHAVLFKDSTGRPVRGSDRQRGIDRAIQLLEVLQAEGRPMTAGELARAMEAPRSTVYEIVARLTAAQMLEAVGDSGRLFFGRAMHLYGAAYLRRDAGMRRIGEALDALSAATGSTVQLCALKGDKYVVLDCRDGAGAFRITSEIGSAVPLPWTASGRLLVRHLSDAAIRAFIPPADFRLPSGRSYPVDSFLHEVAEARTDGFSETTGLASSFTWCQAVRIVGRGGPAEFTLCFVLPIDTAAEHRARCLTLLRTQAALLGRRDGI